MGGRCIASEVADAPAGAILPTPRPSHALLSDRESRIFRKPASGQSVNEMAQELYLSVNTVSTGKRSLPSKLAVENKACLVIYAVKHQLIQQDVACRACGPGCARINLVAKSL